VYILFVNIMFVLVFRVTCNVSNFTRCFRWSIVFSC